jgi:hypothetical protein
VTPVSTTWNRHPLCPKNRAAGSFGYGLAAGFGKLVVSG